MEFFNINLSESTVFFVALFMIFCSFLACLFLLVFSKVSSRKLKVLYIFLSFLTSCISIFLVDKKLEIIGYFKCLTCVIGMSLIFFIPLYFVNFRSVKVNKKEKKLIAKIDEKIKNENTINKIMSELLKNTSQNSIKEEVQKKPIKERFVLKEEKKETKDEIDFSHVKNVLKRVSNYNLNSLEKKEIRELESNILESELNGISKELKTKVNDGLNSLLKIMAKYSS